MYRTGAIYDPAVHIPRDADELKRLCAIAEEISTARMVNTIRMPLTLEQKTILKKLNDQNVHAHTNPFHFSPMGFDNNIYRANPPDLLHLFCAGLMKSLTQWTLTIILALNSKCKKITIILTSY